MEEWQADDMIGEIKALQGDRSRFEKIANKKIENIDNEWLTKAKQIDGEIQFMKDQLAAFFLTVNKKDSKTQQSYSLLSGKLVMKKATKVIVHDDVLLMDWMETNASNYIKQSITNKIEWGRLKKNLSITNGKIINSDTGEIIESEGLFIEDVKEKFEIK